MTDRFEPPMDGEHPYEQYEGWVEGLEREGADREEAFPECTKCGSPCLNEEECASRICDSCASRRPKIEGHPVDRGPGC